MAEAESKPQKVSAQTEKKFTTVMRPTGTRGCTDIICLILWLVCAAGFITIACLALTWGNLNYVLYPVDYLGQFCGLDDGVASRPKVFYPRLNTDIETAMPLLVSGPSAILKFRPYGLCVEECPTEVSLSNPDVFGGDSYPGAQDGAPIFYSERQTLGVGTYCFPIVESLPAESRKICGDPTCVEVGEPCAEVPSLPDVKTAWVVNASTESLCEFSLTEVTSTEWLPDQYDSRTGRYEGLFASAITGAYGAVGVIASSLDLIYIMGLGAPFAIAIAWFILLFLFAGLLIWTALIVALVFLIAATVYLYAKAGLFDVGQLAGQLGQELNTSAVGLTASIGEDAQSGYTVAAAVTTVVLLVYALLIFLWRHNIAKTIAIVRETTKVFLSIPTLMVYPLVPVAFNLLLLAYTVSIAGFLLTISTSNFEDVQLVVEQFNQTGSVDPFESLGAEETRQAMLALHLFGCLWGFFFISSAAYMTYAGAAARWFFSHENGVLNVSFLLGIGTVADSAWCVISRHLGSVAFGSLIMAIVTAMRLVLEYVDMKTKALQETNILLKLVIKCTKCVLWCAYKTIKFISEYGYIFVAVEGSSFCKACVDTFGLVATNIAQVAVNKLVSTLLSLLILLSISISCAFGAFLWAESEGISEPVWPALTVFASSFLIAKGVCEVFRCTIDTLFLCAFRDMKVNSPPYYMSDSLRDGYGLEPAPKDSEEVKLVDGEGGEEAPPEPVKEPAKKKTRAEKKADKKGTWS